MFQCQTLKETTFSTNPPTADHTCQMIVKTVPRSINNSKSYDRDWSLDCSFILDTSSNTIENLKKQLQERDLKLTDAQLEALSSAHQLEQLKELLNAMRCEMSTLRADNERLQKLVRVESDPNEETSYNTGDEDSNTVSIGTRSSMSKKVSDYLPDTSVSNNAIEMFSEFLFDV